MLWVIGIADGGTRSGGGMRLVWRLKCNVKHEASVEGADGDVEEDPDLEGFLAADSKDKSRMDAEESQTWSTFDVVEIR
jgi:hypothetical protein